MAERGPVGRAAGRERYSPPAGFDHSRPIVVVRPFTPGITDLPGPFQPDPTPPTRPTSSSSSGTRAAQRTQTFQAAQGPVPTIFGGPIKVGGFIIAAKQIGQRICIDFALGEGQVYSIANHRWGGKNFQQLGATIAIESHLGIPGDVTSTLMGAFIPGYTTPDNLAHVVCRFDAPATSPPDQLYNPFDFTCDVEGILLENIAGAAASYSRNIVRVAETMLRASRYSIGMALSEFVATPDWQNGEAFCDGDPGDGTKRWEFCGRIDQRDTLENHLNFVLAHCGGHTRYASGQIGLWMDQEQTRAQWDDGNQMIFCDNDDNATVPANLAAEVTWQTAGREQMSTVIIADYTDHAAGDVDNSVQVPRPADMSPTVDWVEQRYTFTGFPTSAMAERRAAVLYNLAQRDRTITLQTFRQGVVPVTGDRVGCDSRRLMAKTDAVPFNDARIFGVDDLRVVDQKISENTVTLRCLEYRKTDYDPLTGTPPGPPDPGPGFDGTTPTPPIGADHAPYIDPTGVSFGWIHQGASTVVSANSTLYLENAVADGSNHYSALQIAAPLSGTFSSWTLTLAASFVLPLKSSDRWWAGLSLNDGFPNETGTVYGPLIDSTGTNLTLTAVYNGGAFGTSGGAGTLPYNPIWLRVSYDGTTATYYYSPDGYNFTLLTSGGGIPDGSMIGFAVGNFAGSGDRIGMRLLSWQLATT